MKNTPGKGTQSPSPGKGAVFQVLCGTPPPSSEEPPRSTSGGPNLTQQRSGARRPQQDQALHARKRCRRVLQFRRQRCCGIDGIGNRQRDVCSAGCLGVRIPAEPLPSGPMQCCTPWPLNSWRRHAYVTSTAASSMMKIKFQLRDVEACGLAPSATGTTPNGAAPSCQDGQAWKHGHQRDRGHSRAWRGRRRGFPDLSRACWSERPERAETGRYR